MDSALGSVDSALRLVDSTLGSMDSVLALVESTLGGGFGSIESWLNLQFGDITSFNCTKEPTQRVTFSMTYTNASKKYSNDSIWEKFNQSFGQTISRLLLTERTDPEMFFELSVLSRMCGLTV